METELASWMERTTGLPLAFAQVREDALQDRWIVDSLAPDARVLMIASGGCTAALLATRPNVAQLHLVDANPAQLALAQLKLRLLTLPVEKRLAILGHTEMDASSRAATLTQLLDELQQPTTIFGPFDFVVEKGPDHVGRYELLFDRLRAMLGEHLPELHRAMSLSDPNEQASCLAPGTELGDAFDRAIDDAMFLPTLVHLFGPEPTKNPVQVFSRHFAERTRHVLATLPANTNPYLWQMLAGRFSENAVSPWLEIAPQATVPEIHYTQSFMAPVLEDNVEKYDFVHISNILDWLTIEEAVRTLSAAWRALRPGGMILIRQLNSSLDIRAMCEQFQWDASRSEEMQRTDRSFFYRGVHLGRKP